MKPEMGKISSTNSKGTQNKKTSVKQKYLKCVGVGAEILA
jgi:hypothetical protein